VNGIKLHAPRSQVNWYAPSRSSAVPMATS